MYYYLFWTLMVCENGLFCMYLCISFRVVSLFYDFLGGRSGNRFLFRGQDLVAHRGKPRVHQQHAAIADLHRDVGSGANEHVDVGLHRHHVDRRVRNAAISLPSAERGYGDRREESSDAKSDCCGANSHRSVCFPAGRGSVFMVFIFTLYSGYMVSAPPREASGGMPYAAGNSLRNGFAPGR